MMEITSEKLRLLRSQFGDAFYILDPEQFGINFNELKASFTAIYPKFNIAYSYKTNYTPRLCELVNDMGGYAEVVSEMEIEIAKRVGCKPNRIIWNGPIKHEQIAEEFICDGGTINIDNIEELEFMKQVALRHQDKILNLGIRCNYEVDDGVLSRFGFDTDGEDFVAAIRFVTITKNVKLINLQCHFAKRAVDYLPARAKGMVNLIERLGIIPERIDIGGGMFGKMADSLKAQFSFGIPDYDAYSQAAATVFADYFKDKKVKPELVLEPGSALVGDCMKFVGTVKSIKSVRGKYFASVLGSQKNISMTSVNPPMKVVSMGGEQREYKDLDFVGYTCIEDDVLYHNYTGVLAVGDAIAISNCGSYSIVMKPPFILPNFPVLELQGDRVTVIKRQETFDDLFHTYNFG